jgi:hypothetical protein
MQHEWRCKQTLPILLDHASRLHLAKVRGGIRGKYWNSYLDPFYLTARKEKLVSEKCFE